MKLQIKKKYFDRIKSGLKRIDFRDAHITFICIETGETLKKDIQEVHLDNLENIPISPEEKKELFEGKRIIGFVLK